PLMRTKRITPDHIRRNQKERLTRLEALPVKGWPCNTLGNHDSSRIHTAFGDKQHDADLARLNAALVLTLKGTPFLYNGEEIGMSDTMLTDISQVKDTMGSWYYHAIVTDMGVHPEEAMIRTAEMTRDKNRTPMQWSNQANAGFSPEGISTWLPINPNYKDGVNVFEQEQSPGSMLKYYKQLLQIRKSAPALVEGDYQPVHEHAEEYFAFLRISKTQSVLVVLNYSETRLELDFSTLDEVKGKHLRPLFSSVARPNIEESSTKLTLHPFEV